jgi:protease I
MKKLLIISFACLFSFFATDLILAQEGTKAKKAIMVIAKSDFRDEELEVPKTILEESGVKVIIASSSLRTAKGMLGLKVDPDISVEEIELEDYDALIFVGGIGAREYWDDPGIHKLIKDALNSDKVLGAICIAPVTLANAGVLKDKRATVWPSEANRLRAKGAIYTGSPVEIDGNIITADGPGAAEEFGEAIVEALEE